jgi:putative ABC transport system permease protein
MPLLRLAYRNLLRHKGRSLATTVGIALGIAAVLATLSVGANVRANVRSTLQAAAGKAELLITSGVGGRAFFTYSKALKEATKTPGVSRVRPVLNYRAEPIRDIPEFQKSLLPGIDSGFQLSGRQTQFPADLPTQASTGHIPTAGSEGIAIGEGFAHERGIKVGETVRFATPYGKIPFKVTGLLNDSLGLASTNGGRIGLVNIADLQKALHMSGRTSYLAVITTPQAAVEQVRKALEARLGENYTVAYPAGSGDITSGIVETIQAGLRVLAVTLIVLGGFMAYNTFAAGVVERTREYALLRTICLTRGQVQRLALAEAALLSLVGVALGLALGVALSFVITRLNAITIGFEFRTLVIPVSSVLLASGVGVATSLLAGFLPAQAASRTPPLVAARRSEEATQPTSLVWGALLVTCGVIAALSPWPGFWALLGSALAMILLFVGLALLTPLLLRPALAILRPLLARLFGLAGRLGADFTARNPARNGVAIGAVVVGLGLTIGVGAMVSGINGAVGDWVDSTIVGDMYVTSPVGFPADFAAEAKARVPGLARVSGVGLRAVRFKPGGGARARTVALVLVNPERFNPKDGFGSFQFIGGQGNNEEAYKALNKGAVLTSSTVLDRFGASKGSSVTLRTDQGFKSFPVAGVVVDFTGGGETFVMSIKNIGLFGGGGPDFYVMTVKPGVDVHAARQALQHAFPQLYLDATLNQDYKARILELTQQSFATTNALLFLAILIAALGVANTLGMNLSRRRREIAMLRALGLTRRGVRLLVGAEGIVIIIVGTILGIGCGLLLSQVITAGANALTGYRISPAYPWRLIAAALISSPVVGLIASLVPARRAARLAPKLALSQ